MALTDRSRWTRFAIAIALFALFPAAYFFQAGFEASPISVCFFYTFTDFRCPFCGLTRALANGLHGNFDKAFAYHPAWFVAAFALFAFASLLFFDSLANKNSLGMLFKKAPWLITSIAGGIFAIGLLRSILRQF